MGKRFDLLGRGVWQAPWLGPNGELVLVAVNREHKAVGDPVIVPNGASRISAADALMAALDEGDPMPDLRII